MSSPSNPTKRLVRSRTDKFLGGVCGGVAAYVDLDPAVVRVLWVVLTLVLSGAPLVLYIVMLFVVPQEPPSLPPAHNAGADGPPIS